MKTQLIEENENRKSRLHEHYDPQTGIGCSGDRVAAGGALVPVTLLDECPAYEKMTSIEQERARVRHDFEYWCWRCVKITDKMTGRLIPFVLNRPQRRLLAEMERQRLDGKPVRIILLKARQWGGSTLVQVYIAWFQIAVYKGKNSIIVGHKRNSSFAIKNMLRTLLANYPKEMLDEDEELKLANMRDCNDIQEITSRDCSICLTSSYSPDSARGLNLSFAHLSEVAFWNSNRNRDPNDLIRTVTGTIPLAPGTVIVMESTANGVNSFFYDEWMRAKAGKSSSLAVFVPWNEIELYQRPLDEDFDPDAMDEYERGLWDKGCTLEQIYWYHEKRKEFSEHNLLKAEFPSDDKEAFEYSMKMVFTQHEQEQIVENVQPPLPGGREGFAVWQEPGQQSRGPQEMEPGNWDSPFPKIQRQRRYLAVLTIGSETDERWPSVFSIWSVPASRNEVPHLAAQWSGNMALNSLALMATSKAATYDNALLVIENNDLRADETSMQQGLFVAKEIFLKYKNLYFDHKKGFVFNIDRKNYSLMFYELVLCARNGQYIDRDERAARATARMIILPNGRYCTEQSENQQFLVNRAEVLYVIRDMDLKSNRDL